MSKLQTKPTTQHEHTIKQYWESRAQHFLQIDLAYVNERTNSNNFIEQNVALVFIYFQRTVTPSDRCIWLQEKCTTLSGPLQNNFKLGQSSGSISEDLYVWATQSLLLPTITFQTKNCNCVPHSSLADFPDAVLVGFVSTISFIQHPGRFIQGTTTA